MWAHHMFATGMGHDVDVFFAAGSALIAVPTGTKIFNWIATMWGGKIRFTTAMQFASAFLIEFTIGGLSGVIFAVVPMDWQLTDTYVIVAHIHYVLFGGTLFGLFAGIYYWYPKMTGRMLNERLGRWHFWLTVIGFNATFFVQHMLGFRGMTRRVSTYPDLPGWGLLNMISTVGAFILGGSMLLLLVNLYRSRKHGEFAGDNPWQAWTLDGQQPLHRLPITSRRCRPCTAVVRCRTSTTRMKPTGCARISHELSFAAASFGDTASEAGFGRHARRARQPIGRPSRRVRPLWRKRFASPPA